MPRTLAHVLSAAEKGDDKDRFWKLPAPDTIIGPCERAPIRVDGLLRREGLYNIFHPECEIARPCVFKASGWANGRLSLKEFCRAFDLPLMLDSPLADSVSARRLVARSSTPVVVAAIFDIIWSSRTGGVEAAAWAVERSGTRTLPNEGKEKQTGEEWSEHRSSEDQQQKAKDCNNQSPSPKCKDNPSGVTPPLGNAGLRLSATPAADHMDEVAEEVEPVHKARLDRIKREHDLAKAVKSDDAEVPVHIWYEAICGVEPSQECCRALAVLRAFMVQVYRRRLLKDVLGFLGAKYGGLKRAPPKTWCFAEPGWRAAARGGAGSDRQASQH